MNIKPSVLIEPRDVEAFLAALSARRAGYTPEWQVVPGTAGAALAAVSAHYLDAVARRLNRAPERLKTAFLDAAGVALLTAQSARAPVVFQVAGSSPGGSAPAGTALAAPPPKGAAEQVLFETESAVAITAGRLVQVVSLWPGRDEYIDHSPALLAREPLELFAPSLRQPTPHHLYLAHDVLLALAGNVEIEVEFEVRRGASEALDLVWEYWDGETWRGFVSIDAACADTAAGDPDSTDGLVQSGRYVLRADGAAAKPTSVDGRSGHWLRARLTQPLPPTPGDMLPEVDTVRLSSTVNRALRGRIGVAEPARPARAALAAMASAIPTTPSLTGLVTNDAGHPIEGAIVHLVDPANPARPAHASQPTSASGRYEIPNVDFLGPAYLFEATFAGIVFTGPAERRRPRVRMSAAYSSIDLTLSVEGQAPDKVFADATALDVTKPFYPMGQQPQPGTAFYFTSAEIFSKPGAAVRMAIARTASPQDAGAVSGSTALAHQVHWQYWNGRQWTPLPVSAVAQGDSPDLDRTEVVDFVVPPDMEPVVVNGETARWVRVRLQSGAYGYTRTIAFDTGTSAANTFTYVAAQPPVLSSVALGYTWQYGPLHAERVISFNDFAYADRTEEARWPGTTFQPFERIADATPALYLGFDKKAPVGQLGLFFDVREAPGDTTGPALTWEYWNGLEWRRTPTDDGTGHLRRPGIINVLAQADDAPHARFGRALHWLRARLKEDGPPGAPVCAAIAPNAVWASERRTLRDLPIGTSNGTPDQAFVVTQTPVLAGEHLEVRELSGGRANVEWRVLAMELSHGDSSVVTALEAALAREGADPDVVHHPLRLRRDRRKRVTEAWVRWSVRDELRLSGPTDRHYALDRARGVVTFGDGRTGRVPPGGAAVLMRQMTAGGGTRGNVGSGAIAQLLGGVPGIEAVFNPRAAEGGADGEALPSVLQRGPRTVAHRGRAIGPSDYEAMALGASPAIALARAIGGLSAYGDRRPGWVTLLIIPHGDDPRPYPSFGLREHVRRYVESRAPADLAALHRIHVTGPTYLPIGVTAHLTPVDPAEAAATEARVRAVLERFLHPLAGGPTGAGWDLGRDVYLSDVASSVERTPGVDHLDELALTIDGVPQGESVAVDDMAVVAAGPIVLLLTEAEA